MSLEARRQDRGGFADGMIRLELEHDSIAFFQAVAQAGKGTYTSHTGSMMESVLLSVLTPEPGS